MRTPDRVAADANDELRAFLDERVEHLIAHGMSPKDARAEALRRLGSPLGDALEQIQDSAVTRERAVRTRQSIDDLEQDVRYAVRTLGRDRAFTLSAVAIIALGIGASATVFSVADALLVRPLPFRDPDQLVWMANGTNGGLSGQTAQVNHLVRCTSSIARSPTSQATSRSTASATRTSSETATLSASAACP